MTIHNNAINIRLLLIFLDEKKTQVLSQNINKTPQGQAEASMQHEITKLTTENLDLRIRYDSLASEMKKYKNQSKTFSKKLKEAGITTDTQPEEVNNYSKSDVVPIVRKKETNYLGMYDFHIGDEKQIIRNLIYGELQHIEILIFQFIIFFIDFLIFDRFETTGGIDTASGSSGLRHFHVHPSRRLHQQRREDPILPHRHHQRHPPIDQKTPRRSRYVRSLARQYLPTSSQFETVQRRKGIHHFILKKIKIKKKKFN